MEARPLTSSRRTPQPLPPRTRLALAAGRATSWLSPRLGRGRGTVIGGRVALRLDPRALTRLADGRTTAIVAATNDKSTTTTMLAAALRTVAHNDLGSNMEAGLIVALDRAQTAPFAILEDDELYLGPLLRATRPRVLTLVDRRVVTRPNAELGLPALSGYETRRGRAMLGPGVARSPSSRSGPGEVATPTGHATDGAVQGHVVGTWFHGPVLPRNPELADLLLE